MSDPIIVNPERDSYDPDLVDMKDEAHVLTPIAETLQHVRVYIDHESAIGINLADGVTVDLTNAPRI